MPQTLIQLSQHLAFRTYTYLAINGSAFRPVQGRREPRHARKTKSDTHGCSPVSFERARYSESAGLCDWTQRMPELTRENFNWVSGLRTAGNV